MNMELKMQVLKETIKKIDDLRQFNVPVITKTIEEYEAEGVEEVFINQQKVLLEKVYTRLGELEAKKGRILQELMGIAE